MRLATGCTGLQIDMIPLQQAPVAPAPPALTDALQHRFTLEGELGRGGMGCALLLGTFDATVALP